MKKWLLLFLLASPTVARAELVQPNFTQGSMNSTTTTTTDITEEIVTTTYGAALNKWSGDNITHTSASSGGLAQGQVRPAKTPPILKATTSRDREKNACPGSCRTQ